MADRDSRLGGARPLGTPPVSRRDKLSESDLDDLFQFSLTGKSRLDLDLSGMKKANFNVELYALKVPLSQIPKKIRNLDFRKVKAGVRAQYLQLVSASKKAGAASEAIDTELTAGDYLVRVTRRKGTSKYLLNVNSTFITDPKPDPVKPPVGAGNSLDKAYLTTVPTPSVTTTASKKVEGTVNDSDKQDYYKFSLTQAGTFTFNASNFQGKADLQLLNSNGGAIQTYTLDSANPQSFDQTLAAGTYYLRIYQEATGDATTYSLTATKKPVVIPPPDKGNSFDTSFSATVPTTTSINGSFTATDKLDYYKFTAAEGDYQFNLAGNAKIEFFNANKQVIKTTYDPGDTKFIQPLGSGTYYFKVSQRSAGTTASYTITASKMGDDKVSNTIPTTVNLTSLPTTMTKVASNYVVDGGKKSSVDYYRFSVNEFSSFTAELQGMFENLDVRLFNVNDAATDLTKDTPYNSKSNTSELIFPGALEQGDYILQVFAPEGEGSTYDLRVALAPTDGKPFMTANINNNVVGDTSSKPKNLVEVGNVAFFVATDKAGQTALYRTTGTVDKLKRIRNFDSVGNFTVAADNAFYFTANGGSGNELWQCTTTGEVKAITNFADPLAGFDEGKIAVVGNYVYFTADAKDNQGSLLRRASLTSAQPTVDSTFASNLLADDITELVVVDNNHLFFNSTKVGEADGIELWRIFNAGTSATVTPEKINLDNSGGGGSVPSRVMAVGNNTLYMLAYRNNASRLVKLENILGAIDSNLNDTVGMQATNINLGANGNDIDNMFLFQGATGADDDILYFTATANDGSGSKGTELLKLTNPQAATASSTLTVVDVRAGSSSSSPSDLIEFNGKLYFTATDGTNRNLWYLDSTLGPVSINEGLLDATDPTSNVSYNLPPGDKWLTVVGNTLYLVANSNAASGNTGFELWQVKADNTLSLVEDINLTMSDSVNTDNSNPNALTVIGSSLFFIADDGINGNEVWSVTPSDS